MTHRFNQHSPLKRRTLITGAAAAATVGLSGCLQNPHPTGGAGGGLNGYVDGGSTDNDKKVTILGAFAGQEQDAFRASLTAFEKESGISIQYTGDSDFTTTIKQKVQAGDAPDIALFPQPGGLFEMAAAGKVQPIDTFLDYDALDASLIPGFLESARYKGRVYGAPMRMACKSIVWYPKKAYEAGGYGAEPATIQDLYRIADTMKAAGITPWTEAWNADQSTGWVGTDWIEEYMLRLHGPQVYDDWVYHRIPFDDARVIEAFDAVGELLKTPGNVNGGVPGILNTNFSDAPLAEFAHPPKALLLRQGNFITGFFPKEIQDHLDQEVGIFPLPRWEGGFDGLPILGGGDLAALFNGNDPDSQKVMQFLTSPSFGGPWAAAGGWLSPHKTFNAAQYPNETTRRIAQIASSAAVFRYDGSDSMPKSVGSGSFWTGMVEWLNGSKTSRQVCQEIEKGWPRS
ncbi:ABC transporter substrate-binding protein [Devriesea agamarum]|uniref:ABC transporter substrate-binding protein n=1 Tax=Devriesea agamarum TaxID=472569 RepID=UPI00071D260C|nr:ABC transporter substrate-binding protein [Devriesea agamarum]